MENRILVIEDDAAIAQTLKLNLECAGYAVTAFDNGLAVWNSLEQEHNYDLALLVRMEKVLDRSGKRNPIYHFRDLTLDSRNRILTRNGTEIPLPPLEFDVLAVLMKNKNRTVSRDRILNEIWGQDYFGDIRTVDVRIANLRKKLGLSEEIRTISKAGYRLEERRN